MPKDGAKQTMRNSTPTIPFPGTRRFLPSVLAPALSNTSKKQSLSPRGLPSAVEKGATAVPRADGGIDPRAVQALPAEQSREAQKGLSQWFLPWTPPSPDSTGPSLLAGSMSCHSHPPGSLKLAFHNPREYKKSPITYVRAEFFTERSPSNEGAAESLPGSHAPRRHRTCGQRWSQPPASLVTGEAGECTRV